MPHAVFSHANGYPSGAYAPLFNALEERGLPDITPFDHRPLWSESPAPTFLSWRTYAQDLIDSLDGLEHPLWLVGLMSRCRHAGFIGGPIYLRGLF